VVKKYVALTVQKSIEVNLCLRESLEFWVGVSINEAKKSGMSDMVDDDQVDVPGSRRI
jgi:hypothetical protein